MNTGIKILIDNGHGCDTPGKCSPDGSFREYAYTREIAERVVNALRAKGYDAERIVTEEEDIPLSVRVQRVNGWCSKLGPSNVVLVSIHNDAAGADGQWHTASGWTGWVSCKASDRSGTLARLLYAQAEKRGLKGNRSVPTERYWMKDYYILKHTGCPAVLTENLFQDNRDEVAFLLSEAGKDAVTQLHADALVEYIDSFKE